MIRVYPIRVSRKFWHINIYCLHECNSNCERIIIFELDTPNEYHISSSNPHLVNGKCNLNNKIVKTFIRLSTFDRNNPKSEFGFIANINEIVIPDTSFDIAFFFPFSIISEMSVTSSHQFSLKDLIHCIKDLYSFIYDEEERTATPQTYNLRKVCSTCNIKDLTDFVSIEKKETLILKKEFDGSDENLTCSICFNSFLDTDEKCLKLKCNHMFHEACIIQWIFKTSNTCPLCRKNIYICTNCDGSGIIYYTFNGVVIPIEERGSILNRNRSNGRFGIHSYDFEDLILENMFYDRIKKKLFLNISA